MMYKQDIEKRINDIRVEIQIAMNRYDETGDINQRDFANVRKRQLAVWEKLLTKARKKTMTPEQAYARNVVGIRW